MTRVIDGTVTPAMITRMRRCPCEICKKEADEMEEHLMKSRKIMESISSTITKEENDKT